MATAAFALTNTARAADTLPPGEPPRARCTLALTTPSSTEYTIGFIAYLEELLAQHIVESSTLNTMLAALEQGSVVNPISKDTTFISSAHRVHFDSIEDLIKDNTFEKEILATWLRKNVHESTITQQQRTVVRNEAKSIFENPLFNQLPAGAFTFIAETKPHEVELTHPFEMMATPITQRHWIKLMGKNPANFEGLLDNPVEQVTWYSAIVFANRLSEKEGLAAAYDLSGVVFDPNTSAEAGTLKLMNGSVRANSQSGSIYETVGYRLPTTAERQWVVSNMGEVTKKIDYLHPDGGPLPFGIKMGELTDYGWFQKNSNNSTQPIATNKEHAVVNGQAFYDMIGNVAEWNHDWHEFYFRGGKDPQGPDHGQQREIFRSGWGHWLDAPNHIPRVGTRDHISPDMRTDWLGFRLVRTLH